MNWEQKTEMCRHLNTSEYQQALDLVIANIATMDEQAWDMFYNGIELTEESLKPLIDKHKIIRLRNSEMRHGSYRTAIRASLYEMNVDHLLGLREQPPIEIY